jgi:hypothetical protein
MTYDEAKAEVLATVWLPRTGERVVLRVDRETLVPLIVGKMGEGVVEVLHVTSAYGVQWSARDFWAAVKGGQLKPLG